MISRSLICLISKSHPQMETISAREQVSIVRAVVTLLLALGAYKMSAHADHQSRWPVSLGSHVVGATGAHGCASMVVALTQGGSRRPADIDGSSSQVSWSANKPQVILDSTLIASLPF